MWWVFGGLGALLYLMVMFTLGMATIRKGHWALFIFGIAFPLLWIVGGLMPGRDPAPSV